MPSKSIPQYFSIRQISITLLTSHPKEPAGPTNTSQREKMHPAFYGSAISAEASNSNSTTPPSVLATVRVGLAIMAGAIGIVCFALWRRRRSIIRAQMAGSQVGYPGEGPDSGAVPYPAEATPQPPSEDLYPGVHPTPGVGAVPGRQWYSAGVGHYPEAGPAPGAASAPDRQWYGS